MAPIDYIQRFQDHMRLYIDGEKCHGEDGLGEKRDFVPREAVFSFDWTTHKIIQAIRSKSKTAAIPDTSKISENFAVVFSILVSLPKPKPEDIELFMQYNVTDDKLPLSQPPSIHQPPDESNEHASGVSRVANAQKTFQEFIEHQWKFCPFLLNRQHMEHLDDQRVLPIEREEILFEKRIVKLQKVKVHRDCRPRYKRPAADFHWSQNSNQDRIQTKGCLPSTLILKEFQPRGYQAFEREVRFYSQLQPDENPYIANYYGSFVQKDRRVIVLECGSGGDLGNFLQTHSSIENHLERNWFWKSLVGLLKGLDGITTLHQKNVFGRSPGWELKASHQDIRPQNILVFRNDNSFGSRYQNISFKFVDFGESDVRTIRVDGLDPGVNPQEGNTMYSSPEATIGLNYRTPLIQQKSDIWSLGAVMSETLVWSITGYQGVEDYLKRRQAGIDNSQLRGGLHYGAFHDGEARLSEVFTMHEAVVREGGDPTSESISSMILDHMLRGDYNNRGSAGSLHNHIIQELGKDNLQGMPQNGDSRPWHDEHGPGAQYTDQAGTDDLIQSFRLERQSASSGQRPLAMNPRLSNSPPAPPHGGSGITVDTLHVFIKEKDKFLFNGKGMHTYARVVQKYPEIGETIKTVKGATGNRDQIFIIDNSRYMEQHRQALAKTVRVLAWLLKRVDRDKMEMAYTSPGEVQLKQFKRSQELERSILYARFEGQCYMGESLSRIFMNSGRLDAQSPLSIYVLTNGRWQNDRDENDLCGVDEFVAQVIEKVRHRGNRWVGFQFIRFFESDDRGPDQVGQLRLKTLDDDLPGMLQGKGYQPLQSDIIDTRDFNEDVGKMMKGIISQAGDNS